MKYGLLKVIFVAMVTIACMVDALADSVSATVPTGSGPSAVAVDSVTNKIYVANYGDGTVTVIDGATNSTSLVTAGSWPSGVAVNPVTHKIYVANAHTGNNVTVIDGATNATSTVNVGVGCYSIVVNPITNKIYALNNGSNSVTVIDGATNTTNTVSTGSAPYWIAVNTIANKIYVANKSSNNVTIIDGATNLTTTVATGSNPEGVAVNPVTNMIYVTNFSSGTVTVINGTTNSTTTVNAGSNPHAMAVNPVTDMIYVVNEAGNTVTIINGTSNSTTTVNVGSSPKGIVVNSLTNKIYVGNSTSSNVTVIDGATNSTTTLSAGTGPCGGQPWSIAVNMLTNKVYVANNGSNNVTVIAGPPNVPTLSSPANGTLNVPFSAFLSWNSVSGATSYRVQLSNTSSFSLVSDTTLAATSRTVSSLAANSTFYWRVYATNAIGNSAWSSIWSFTTSVPVTPPSVPALSSPANGALNVLLSPTLSWNNVSGATFYRVQLYTSSSLVSDTTLAATYRTVSSLTANTPYYWRVYATNTSGSSAWSSFWSFTTLSLPSVPILSTPGNGAASVPVNTAFSWNSSGNSSYTLQVSTAQNFQSTVFSQSGLTSTLIIPNVLQQYRYYKYQVDSINLAGPNEAILTETHFISGSNAYPPAGSFSLLSSSAASSGNVSALFDGDTTATSGYAKFTIAPWQWVIDMQRNYKFDAFYMSSWQTYFYHEPSRIEVFGAVSSSGPWNQLASQSFSAIYQSATIPLTFNASPGLLAATTYYWRVNATNAGGTSTWSNTWSFTTGSTAVIPQQKLAGNAAIRVSLQTGTLHYSLPASCYVNVKYYDLKGRFITSLINQYQTAGSHSFPVPISSWAKGTYFQLFEAGNILLKDKVVLLR